MKTSNQYPMILSRLHVLTIIFIAILRTGASNYDVQLFRKTTESECLKLPIVRTEYTSSVTECALRCMMNDTCGYFSYCNGPCKMYKLFYWQYNYHTKCDCVSYFTLSGNRTSWQKIFEMRTNVFKRNPAYRYWKSLSIDKVKLILRKNDTEIHSLTFTARKTNIRSWFHSSNLISKPWFGKITANYTFDDKEERFTILPGGFRFNVMVARKHKKGYYKIHYRKVAGDKHPIKVDAMEVYILLM
ncbi:uncharacterized protein LOC106876621 isoform X2 [Octopus bimaculoides]|uniref:Uncharacterized protein n=2 Tax=Octopus bimaculoides TaxID=37653 RepID=A0A0L8GII5_OCTBM|nr:uncharacterized protein LOC106876621 isoform X2 [Octopus bimaculoides]XP_014780720.1 uncharacterized protein LOC106876621 isoform X2 [Octopus bimaculoides]XP_014780722.1 uncharacterized protein LOC106876621 isoform X2 [Octopus bimaculoides]XP_052825997.1 uncharacterized protein LOC106876621 isoform X2 [Octopus bimaculoides]XP_052825998.1 uncharacterized protein LOC106876621 isoform X2 [Octopus bimaculoides]XP_052826000.1 uncharacterized protein LOC106876621 isoform X2 [Octopus bimaculoides]|eukprot:XP_014780719.1 PREDICTED: uncharacterized protein LOC106876621 [Octopus bimaculoides]